MIKSGSHSLSLAPSLSFFTLSLFFALFAHNVSLSFRPSFPLSIPLSCLSIPDPARLFLSFFKFLDRNPLGLRLNPVKFFWRLIEYICECLNCLFFHPPCCTLKRTLHGRVYLLVIGASYMGNFLCTIYCNIKSLSRR